MAYKNRVVLGLLLVAVAAVLALLFAPSFVSTGLRAWFWWQKRTEKITFQVDKIETPLFRPIILHNVRVQTADNASLRIQATATTVVVGLNLQSILLRTRGHAIRNLAVDDLHAEIRRDNKGAPVSESSFNTLHKLIPDNFRLDRANLRVESGSSVLLWRNVALTGNQTEAGRFQADEAMIASPLFRQSFTGLRGATNWDSERLTIAGLTLSRGLDVQSFTSDFSHLGKRRIEFDFDLDAFGGKIRASIGNEWRSHHSNWNVAGSATDISLAQTAEAIGFTNRIGGLLHGGKFTFRGDLADPMHATASLWAELTAPAWRDREADVIMLGVSLYTRQLELQQLYIKQKKNQLTLSGESSFPNTPSDWLRLDFRGNVSASINDLGTFAALFGGAHDDFAGRIAIEGTVNARDRNIGGNLSASGSALTMFKNSIDEFRAEVNLTRDAIEVERLELKRKGDGLQAHGRIDTSPEHRYSGSLDVTLTNANDYLSRITSTPEAKPMAADFHADISAGVWQVNGMVDPPASKPIRFKTTFPLPIGKPLSALQDAPVALTVDFPALQLNEVPRFFAPGFFQGGVLSGQVSMDETIKHPRIIGDLQLVDGRLGSTAKQVTEVNGRITFQGHEATIPFLDLGPRAAGASFYGALDFHDTNNVTLHLFPNQPVFDLSSSSLNCTDRIDVISQPITFPVSQISELDVRGGLGRPDWTIALREPELTPLSGSLQWDFTRRSFGFCASPNGSESAVFAVAPSQLPKATRPARKHRPRH